MKNEILTAKKFLEECSWESEMHVGTFDGVTPEMIIEFTKPHIKAALQNAYDIASESDLNTSHLNRILNAYPEENIK